MKFLPFIAIILFLSCNNTTQQIRQFAAVPVVQPKIITKGGHYTGVFVGSKDTAAIWIYNTGKDTVWIENATITANAGGGIKMAGNTIVVITNTAIRGVTPPSGYQYGRAIEDYMPKYLRIDGLQVDSTGGILIDHGVGSLVQMYRMQLNNALSITADGKDAKPRQGIQFNTVQMNPASEAQWIEIRNDWKKSRVEDCINFYNSSNFTLKNFCIKGAYSLPGGTGNSISAITIDGSMQEGNNKTTASHNFLADSGFIISTFNAAMNIAAGYNNTMQNIIAVSSGMTPDGVKSNNYWAGTCIFNGNKYPDSIFYANRIAGNVLGFVNNGNENFPYKGRQDEMNNRAVNKMPSGGNTYLPNPVTLATEDSVYALWKAKVKAASVVLGVSSSAVIAPPVGADTVKLVPVVPVQHDTVFVHDTVKLYYYITSRYGVVGVDTIMVKK